MTMAQFASIGVTGVIDDF